MNTFYSLSHQGKDRGGLGLTKMSELTELLTAAFAQHRNLRAQLDAIVDLLFEHWGIQSYICEIKGPRWSFFAGMRDFVTPLQRIKLSERFGLQAGPVNLPDEDWQQIVQLLRELVTERQED